MLLGVEGGPRPAPPNIILPELNNQTDTFEDVGYVIDASFLHLELPYSLVQVEGLVGRFPQQRNKCLSQLFQSILLPSPATTRPQIRLTPIDPLVLHLRSAPPPLGQVDKLLPRTLLVLLILDDIVIILLAGLGVLLFFVAVLRVKAELG